MYISVGDWLKESDAKARAANDTQRLQLRQIYRRGWNNVETRRLDEARAEFERGYKLAQQLDELWWECFFESWICSVVEGKKHYTEALDLRMKLVIKMQRPELKEHPLQARIFYSLAQLYYMIDALGYEDEIYQALDMLEKDILLDRDTHHRMYHLRAAIACENEDWDTAYEHIMLYLNLVDGNGFRQRSGYAMKADIHFTRGEIAYALEAEHRRELAARRARMWMSAAEAVMWQGIFTQYSGDSVKAAALYQRGLLEFEGLSVECDSTFYLIAAEYQTVCGNLDEAFAMREQQLQLVQESGSVDQLFYCRLYRCYLLNQMQKPLGNEIIELERLANQHRKAAFFLKKVEAVKQGRCYPYDWQIVRWQSP
jgi:hypothetical protein